jgi:hypothetical protein
MLASSEVVFMSLMGQSRRKSNVCCDGSFSQVRKSGEGAGCRQPCRHLALRQVSRRGFRLVTESKQEAMPARRQSDGSRSPACHSDTPAEPSAVPQRQTRRDRTRVNRKSSGTSPNIFRITACEPISGLPSRENATAPAFAYLAVWRAWSLPSKGLAGIGRSVNSLVRFRISSNVAC